MKKSFYIVIGILIIVAVLGLISLNNLWQANSANFLETSQDVKKENAATEPVKKEITLTVDNGNGTKNVVSVEFKDNMTAFDLLKAGVEKLSLPLKTKQYDMGIFIEAIGKIENGQNQKYWLYYVNGKTPMVSADKMILKARDKVEYKFENF
ncbi:MAG: DUF4430 domain-containing protein [Patescibacteria group bacterium]